MITRTFLFSICILFCFSLYSQTILPVDINNGISSGLIKETHSQLDIGKISELFDESNSSFIRSQNINPFILTLTFNNSIKIRSAEILMTQGDGKWSIEAANTLNDLTNKIGSYSVIFENKLITSNVRNSINFNQTTKILKVTALRTTGDNYVHLNDLKLLSEPSINILSIVSPTANTEILVGKTKLCKVKGTDGVTGLIYDLNNNDISWSSSDDKIAVVNPQGIITAINPGLSTIKVILGTITAILPISVIKDQNAPDLDVCYIKRLPEINYIANSKNPKTEGWPQVGQKIKWRGYLKNWSTQKAFNVKYKWLLNGIPISTGNILSIDPYSLSYVDLDYNWSFERKELEFIIDPDNSIPETSEFNNNLLIYTNAISLNLYVEQSIYDYFHDNQSKLNLGTNSWEDWAQILHVRRWNRMFKTAIYPETPNGVNDRIRIDSVIVLKDGTLPLNGGLPSNNPNSQDKTVDLQWGYASGPNALNPYKNTTQVSDDNPFYFEGSLLHELGHARYLIDTYGFDVGNATPNIQLKENNNTIVGTSYMPIIAWDIVHLRNNHGLMGGSYTYIDLYSAISLNLIAYQRALCGNMNSPCNIGSFINDLPTQNVVKLLDQDGNIINSASVKIFRATQYADWYGKYYDNIPDIEMTSNSFGEITLGKCPFASDGIIRHSYGLANGVLIIRVEKQGKIGYGFLESTEFNKEFWRGNINTAKYEMRFNLLSNPNISISITSPLYGNTYTQGKIINVSAETPSLNVKKIDFFIDNQLLTTKTTKPFSFDWNTSGYSIGYHKVRALLTDNSDNKIYNEVIFRIEPVSDCIPSKINSISGETNICQNPSNQFYTAKGAKNSIYYIWTITPANAGTISSLDSTATVDFNNTFSGVAQIKVNGRNTCGDGDESILIVNVNSLPNVPGAISGTSSVCQGQNTITYTIPTIANATSYFWSLPSGATGTSTTNSIIVNYGLSAISGNISVKGHNNCGDGTISFLAINVNPLPSAAAAITGNTSVCKSENSLTYSVPAIANATSYIWTLPNGATGTSNTNSLAVTFGTSAISGNISVKGHNNCGDGKSFSLPIVVSPTPVTPIITKNDQLLHSNVTSGNQWYNLGNPIPGATAQDYTITSVGEYSVKVTTNGCVSTSSNVIKDVVTSIESEEYDNKIKVYPNPVSDDLTIKYEGNLTEIKYEIYNSSGQLITTGALMESAVVHTSAFSSGLYTIKCNTGKTFEFRKVIKKK